MEYFNTIFFIISMLAGGVVLHELGHFIFARRYGRKAKFGTRRRGLLPDVIMISQPSFEIKNGQDLKRAFREEAVIAQGGLLGVSVPFVLLGLYWEMRWVCLIWILVLMGYAVVEVGWVYKNNRLENIGELVYLRKD